MGQHQLPNSSWHFLYFLPEPQGQGSLRPVFREIIELTSPPLSLLRSTNASAIRRTSDHKFRFEENIAESFSSARFSCSSVNSATAWRKLTDSNQFEHVFIRYLGRLPQLRQCFPTMKHD